MIRVLAIEILAGNERSRIISREVSCVSFDLSFLKCHCNGKIVDLILIATEQHFPTKFNGTFSFSISCLVSEIFRFLKHAN